MIIQCKQCRTKFRFDDAQMEGDGLWMRCSRCQHVFFQDNPLKINASAVTPQASPTFSKEIPPEKTTGRLSFEPAGAARGGATPDEDLTSFPDDVMTPEKTADDELKTESKPEKMSRDEPYGYGIFDRSLKTMMRRTNPWRLLRKHRRPRLVRKAAGCGWLRFGQFWSLL